MAITGQKFAITSASTASGDVGTTVEITVTANFTISEISIEEGDLVVSDDKVKPANLTAAGVYTGRLRAAHASGYEVFQDITITLNSVSLPLATPANFAVASVTSLSVTFSHDNSASATGYEVVIDEQYSNLRDITTTKKVILANPDTTYTARIRAYNATEFSAWSSQVTFRTLPDVTPGPDPGITPRRSIEVVDAMCLQGHFNYGGVDSPWVQYSGNNGWIEKWYAPMAAVGIKRWRNSFGKQAQTKNIIQALYNAYGTKMDLVNAARVDDSTTPAELVRYAHQNFPEAVSSFQGLNEPNNPGDAGHFANYRDDVLNSMVDWLDEVDRFSDFSDVKRNCWSPWGRRRDAMLSVVYNDRLGPWRTSGTVSLSPYVASVTGATWIDDCLPRVDQLNLHYYTGGRKPTIAGTPGTVLDENGDPVQEISIDDTLHELRILALSTPDYYAGGEDRKTSFPFACTEGGWHYRGPGSVFPNAAPKISEAFVTLGAQAKYTQRLHFELLNRGAEHIVWFEFMDNPNAGDKIYGSLSWRKVGGIWVWEERPFYTTQMNTARLFNDTAGNARTFTKNNLDFSLGNPPTIGGQYGPLIQHSLWQRANGKWLLAFWYDWDSYNRQSKADDFRSKTIRVTINDGAKTGRSIRPYVSNPNNISNWTQYNSGNPTTTFDVVVWDDVTALEVTPT